MANQGLEAWISTQKFLRIASLLGAAPPVLEQEKTNLCSLPLEETQPSVGMSVDPKGCCVSALSPLLFLLPPQLFHVLQTQSIVQAVFF